MTDSAAFFDLDRTLISGTSAMPVGIEAWRTGLASNKDILGWGIAALSFLLLGDKGEGSDDTKSTFLTRIEGASADILNTLGTEVLPKLVAQVRPESKKLLRMHGDKGRDTWIVSASPEVVVAPLAASLGMTGGLGTRGRIIDGHYTGELDGPFMYAQGKADAIEKLAVERGYDLDKCYAYSDSVSDLHMLELVGHPVAVNPDSALDHIAHERGWPVVIFARKTKRALAFTSAGAAAAGIAAGSYLLGRKHGRSITLVQLAKRTLRGG
ncbi:MAG: HAD-IB family hydrolase [Acidimicrobiia bacterium]|nr:HAD-IB family hydrolase [Acidimicrobiia bacterium]